MQTVCTMLDADLRTFTVFLRVVRLLLTYTTFFFTIFNVESLKGSDLEGSIYLFCPCERS